MSSIWLKIIVELLIMLFDCIELFMSKFYWFAFIERLFAKGGIDNILIFFKFRL